MILVVPALGHMLIKKLQTILSLQSGMEEVLSMVKNQKFEIMIKDKSISKELL